MSDEHAASAEYQPILPDHDDFKGVRIDTKDQRYVSAAAAAKEAGLTQAQWTKMLGMEARRVVDAHKAGQAAKPAAAVAAAPVPAPAAAQPATPGKIPSNSRMSFAQKMAAAGHI